MSSDPKKSGPRRKTKTSGPEKGGTSKTGTPIQWAKLSSLKPASPDDPIYTRGFVIGGRYSRRSRRTRGEGSEPDQNENN